MIRAVAATCLTLLAAGAARAGDDRPGPPAARAAIARSGFAGRILVARGDAIVMRDEVGAPGSSAAERPDARGRYTDHMVWPWASVTKQVVATMVMQEVARGRIALEAPASRYLPGFGTAAPAPTIRQLLQHQGGLRNPDDSPPDRLTARWKGQPGFYSIGPTGPRWCLAGRGTPGGTWRYNNCDFILLGSVLAAVTHRPLPALFRERIAAPAGLTASGFAGDRASPRVLSEPFHAGPDGQETAILARFGAAGGLMGTERDLLAFDRALMTGKLLPAAARDTLWRANPALGYMALGQWVFEAPLKGCAAPVRIVERRGAIGRYEVRNIILPNKDMTVIAFTDRPDFDFGEIWQGRGLSHDLLSAVACA